MKQLVEIQRAYFNSHETKKLDFRIKQLLKLKKAILEYEQDIFDALYADFKKSNFETYETEVGMVMEEIKYVIKKLPKWVKKKKVGTPITQFLSSSSVFPGPFGVTLIMSPWNYPFLLTISPLIGSIAAGNCAVIKPSRYAYNISKVMARMINETFDSKYITVVEGGRDVNQKLLEQKFDYIFFTGSPTVGKIVMHSAAENLTPITLELGGKSPCIVDKSANLKLSAKRIVWGKFINAGQTCVAPDYVLVQKKVKVELQKYILFYIKEFYGEKPKQSEDFPRIINKRHCERLKDLIEKSKVIIGGEVDVEELYVSPTVMTDITFDDAVMKEEIFGPILPIIEYENINDVIRLLNNKPEPLALYFFTKDKKTRNRVIEQVSFGGGCINDTICHLASVKMPFGGKGNSGMGSYHGKYSFDTFSHYKGILNKSNFVDLSVRYAPYDGKLNTLKKFL